MKDRTITIERYGNRNWAVRIGGDLLCVTVYKRGARAVVDMLLQLNPGLSEAGRDTSPIYSSVRPRKSGHPFLINRKPTAYQP